MGRGNYVYDQHSTEVYIDLGTYEAAKDAEKNWNSEEEGFEYDLDLVFQNYAEVFEQDLMSKLIDIAGSSFEKAHEWNNYCNFILHNNFVDVGLADNENTMAVVFRPHRCENGEPDGRAKASINRIVNELLKTYTLYQSSSPWTLSKIEISRSA